MNCREGYCCLCRNVFCAVCYVAASSFALFSFFACLRNTISHFPTPAKNDLLRCRKHFSLSPRLPRTFSIFAMSPQKTFISLWLIAANIIWCFPSPFAWRRNTISHFPTPAKSIFAQLLVIFLSQTVCVFVLNCVYFGKNSVEKAPKVNNFSNLVEINKKFCKKQFTIWWNNVKLFAHYSNEKNVSDNSAVWRNAKNI